MSNFARHERFIRKSDHSNISYLKQDEIGVVLAQALADLYKNQPKNQLRFLGNWLVNHSNSSQDKQRERELEEKRESLKEKQSKKIQEERLLQEKKKVEEKKHEDKAEEFKQRIRNSVDVDDFLQELAQYLADETSATSCYIGKLEKTKKQINPMDNETAHLDESAPFVVRYIYTSFGSEFLIEQTLNEQEGEATFSIWKEQEPQLDDTGEANEDSLIKKETPKFVLVPNVLEDPRIKFFDVPKLGSYLAVPLTYKSCLFEKSFNAGVEDAFECRRLRIQQEEEKHKSEHTSNKEEEEEKVFEEIVEAPYKVVESKFVVALDTLGQDRCFTEHQVKTVVEWVEFFAVEWERAENQALKKDIGGFTVQNLKDQQKINEKQADWAEEEKTLLEETIKTLDPTLPDEVKQIETQSAFLELFRKRFIEEFHAFLDLVNSHMVRHTNLIKIALYLSGVDRISIIEPGTNILNWKKAKVFVNPNLKDFFTKLKAKGPKSDKPEPYAKTLKLEKDLLSINIEDVQQYSLSLANLYRFLEQYFKVRVLDVSYRRKIYNNKADERDNAIKAFQDLTDRRKKFYEEAKEAYEKEIESLDEDSEKPLFDDSKLLQEFDENESNKVVEIPPEIVADIDNDIGWDELH